MLNHSPGDGLNRVQSIVLPEKAEILRVIINDALRSYGMTKSELLGQSRIKEFMTARKEVATRMRSAGFSYARIAKVLHRERTTIVHWFNDPMKRRKRLWHSSSNILAGLDDDIRHAVETAAVRGGVSPQTTIRRWIIERARAELSKAVAA